MKAKQSFLYLGGFGSIALVFHDGCQKLSRAPIVKEEDSQIGATQDSPAELVAACATN
jgi:hypothetical protein